MLDKNRPFGEVHGDGVAGAKWFQDGHYYSVDGRYLFSQPGVNPPPSGEMRTLEEAQKIYEEQEAMLLSAASNPPPLQPTLNASDEERVAVLSAMSYFQLAAMVRRLGGEPPQGKGAKERMVRWLIENGT